MLVSMSAKDKILTAYENLLIQQGEKACTLDAVARAAGVSKGGLLYHFPSKEAMALGLIQRFVRLSDEDLELMRTAEEGASAYYINSSFYEDSPFDRALIAVSRLAQESNRPASLALKESQDKATRLILSEVGDADTARAIVLLSDGMYYNAAFMSVIDRGQVIATEENDRRILLKTLDVLRSRP